MPATTSPGRGTGWLQRGAPEARLERLRKRVGEIAAVDFFHGRKREPVEGLIQDLARRLAPPAKPAEGQPAPAAGKPRGRTWVTRTGLHVDRMASAWLIRRFIDPRARFKFVSARRYRQRSGELRFDMFDGEFTHQGGLCTFEVLLGKFAIDDPALRPIAEIVHDIDLKDAKYGRPETPGIERLINGIALGAGTIAPGWRGPARCSTICTGLTGERARGAARKGEGSCHTTARKLGGSRRTPGAAVFAADRRYRFPRCALSTAIPSSVRWRMPAPSVWPPWIRRACRRT